MAANLQTVTSPVTISSFSSTAPAAGSGTASDLALGSTSDTLSSPFVDYVSDTAYVGNDSGVLFRIKDVFCPTTVPIVNPACTGGSPPVPSLDSSWGTSGALTTGCPGQLTGPVVDRGTGNVFVGCSDGKLYGFSTTTGLAVTNSPLTVGNGGTDGGIVDPPLVDVVNGFIYVVSGNSSGGKSVVTQASATDLSSAVTVSLGAGGQFNLHAPAFNDAYFSSGTSTNWVLYALALNTGNTASVLWGLGFNGSHVMQSPAVIDTLGIPSRELSPLTEFVSGGEDRLFESDLFNESDNTVSFRIDGVTTSSFPPSLQSFQSEGSGTSGMIIDNAVTGAAQAESIYFGVLSPGTNGNSAVKLTQAGLN